MNIDELAYEYDKQYKVFVPRVTDLNRCLAYIAVKIWLGLEER